MKLLGAILAAVAAAASVADAQVVQAEDAVRITTIYSLLHRVVDPAAGVAKQPSWKVRGKLAIKHYNIPAPNSAYALQGGRAQAAKEGPGARSSPASPFGGELENLAAQSEWDQLFLGKGRGAWYQLALVEGEPSSAQVGTSNSGDVEGPIAATKACQLSGPAAHELTVHLAPSAPALLSTARSYEFKPYAIEYGVAAPLTLASDGCPEMMAQGTFAVEQPSAVQVKILEPKSPPLPPLRQPAPLREDGTPEAPKQEKSFIAKYWMYLLPAVLLLVIPGESSTGESAEHDASSNRPPNAGQAAKRIK